MNNSKYVLSNKQAKLRQISLLTYTLLTVPMIGYEINKVILLFWVVLIISGGVALAIKSRLIKPRIRFKIVSFEIIVTSFLTIWIFSDLFSINNFIKTVLLFIAILVFSYLYFRLLYSGRLTEE